MICWNVAYRKCSHTIYARRRFEPFLLTFKCSEDMSYDIQATLQGTYRKEPYNVYEVVLWYDVLRIAQQEF